MTEGYGGWNKRNDGWNGSVKPEEGWDWLKTEGLDW